MAYCALVAQLAEHIHGKDKVISSILIEGSAFAVGKTSCKSAALRASDRGLTKMRGLSPTHFGLGSFMLSCG